MRAFYLFALSLVLSSIVSGQNVKIPVGKKIEVNIDSKLAITTSAMGNDMEVENAGNSFSEFAIKSVSDKGYLLTATIKRVKGTLSAAGQDYSFDSDDEATRNNPQFASVIKLLNNPNEVQIENGTAVIKGELENALITLGMDINDMSKLILNLPASDIKQGYKWTDSASTSDSLSKLVNENNITQVNDSTVEVSVNTRSTIKGKIKQGEMVTNQDLQGIIITKRIYNKLTGLLFSEESDISADGTSELMGLKMQQKISGKKLTTTK